ncbi:hypothetical protein BGZ96_001472 [Linnemannia gamsii]|uniref:Uncharacterized protein n=1 Tax=Linnemannia gamsii TaxID=64522 RepID=A0ABQ7JMK1_9FUNG|nr:hypothetical protein BGZ96_001472 [Linnemannia gamsii]
MAVSRTWVLKGSLWIQAVFLLVLTSILADMNAWIGAILTGVGLFFVVIGIIAAHKRRIGYLYFYATLVGLWQILALTHILIICGLITLPVGKIDPAFIIGYKIVENPSYPLKIAIPVLYGSQWCTWCVILVCMVSLRLETVDPTLGFEIQDPKQRHSLDTRSNHASSSYPNMNGGSSNSNSSSSNNNPRMNQHLFNFRQSVIAPIGGESSPASSNSRSSGSGGAGIDGHSITRTNKGKGPVDKTRYGSDIEMPQAPERSWVGMERRASSDSNAIFIPNDPRISQVVVTFEDKSLNSQQEHASRSLFALESFSKQQIPDATTIYITNHHYERSSNIDGNKAIVHDGQPSSSSQSASAAAAGRGLGAVSNKSDSYILNFSASGESFSDMIFKSAQDPISLPMIPLSTATPVMTASPFSTGPVSPPSQQPPAATKEMAEFHSHMDGDAPNPARIRGTGTKVSLTLSSDSSSSELSALSNAYSSDSDDMLEFAPINTTTSANTQVKPQQQTEGPLLSLPPPLPPPPQPQHGPDGVVAGLAMTSVGPLHIIPKNQNQQQPQHIAAFSDLKSCDEFEKESHQHASHGQSGGNNHPPQAQPNSSDSSHSLSSLSSTSTRSRNDDRSERHQVLGTTDHKSTNTSSSQGYFEQPVSNLVSAQPQPQPPSPFNYTPAPFTPFPVGTAAVSVTSTTKKKFQIPTIVIHADDEDGEPPRVLSQQDIEYLTTMPPAPLRPLIQPWDDIQEESDEELYDDGYDDYDDYPHPHHQPHYHDHHQQQLYQQFPTAVGAIAYDYEDIDEREVVHNHREPELMGMRSRIDEAQLQRVQLQQQQQHQQLRRQSQLQDLHNVRAMQFNLSKDGGGGIESEDGPYAFDVPIDLDIDRADLEGLEME